LSLSVNFDFSTLTQLSFYFDFSLFDSAESLYFETLGSVVECESPDPINRGLVFHIGNCLDFTRKRGSPPITAPSINSPPYLPFDEVLPSYSSIAPASEASLNPPAYSPPATLPSTSTALVPYSPPATLPSTSTALVSAESFPRTFIGLSANGRYSSNPSFFFPI
jgi:hypothetical protein